MRSESPRTVQRRGSMRSPWCVLAVAVTLLIAEGVGAATAGYALAASQAISRHQETLRAAVQKARQQKDLQKLRTLEEAYGWLEEVGVADLRRFDPVLVHDLLWDLQELRVQYSKRASSRPPSGGQPAGGGHSDACRHADGAVFVLEFYLGWYEDQLDNEGRAALGRHRQFGDVLVALGVAIEQRDCLCEPEKNVARLLEIYGDLPKAFFDKPATRFWREMLESCPREVEVEGVCPRWGPRKVRWMSDYWDKLSGQDSWCRAQWRVFLEGPAVPSVVGPSEQQTMLKALDDLN